MFTTKNFNLSDHAKTQKGHISPSLFLALFT